MEITEIILVATLHQLHPKVPGYGFSDLNELLIQLKPSALVVELQASEIQDFSQPGRGAKIEYNEVIIPFARKRYIPLHPLEPGGEIREKILKTHDEAWAQAKKNPSYQTFSLYVETLIGQLLAYWHSPLDVNSDVTIESFRLKHSYQDKLLSVDTPSWHQWNEEFLTSILKASKLYRGKRIVVTVGAEHVYWLQDRLKSREDIRILSLKDALAN